MKSTNPTIKKKAKMITALNKSHGIIKTACELVGIHRSTHYQWLKEDDQYRKDVEMACENAIDDVEKKLFDRINAEDTTSIIFYLKTKGKKRGYVERTEVESSGSLETSVNFVVHKDKKDD